MAVALVYIPTVLFLIALAAMSAQDPRVVKEPLSNLRDGWYAIAGYLLFVLLLVVGLGQVRVFARCGRRDDVPFIIVCQILLLVVAVTPTRGCVHGFASFGLLFLLFSYYGSRLLWAESPWLIPHVAIPVLLCLSMCLVGAYGPGQ